MLNSAQEEMLALYYRIFAHRKETLFRDFLPKGYRLTTLSSVEPDFLPSLLDAKWCLGLLITLCDDFADIPRYLNFTLLENFRQIALGYKTPLELKDEKETLALLLMQKLKDRMKALISPFPNFEVLRELFLFDFAQVFNSNCYNALLTQNPLLANVAEARIYQPHNMGIIAAAMMDLMASLSYVPGELGTMRVTFAKAQVIGRLANVLTTTEREIQQGDVTSELLIRIRENGGGLNQQKKSLNVEIRRLLSEILGGDSVKSFSIRDYAASIEALFQLHGDFEGQI